MIGPETSALLFLLKEILDLQLNVIVDHLHLWLQTLTGKIRDAVPLLEIRQRR